jgi:hypothetical protein
MSVTITVNENNFYTELADKIKNELEAKVIILPQPNSTIVWSDKGYQAANGRFYDYPDTVRQRLTAVKCEFSNVSVTASNYGINIIYTVNYTPITEQEPPILYQ